MMTKLKAMMTVMLCVMCASSWAAVRGIPMNAKVGYSDMKWETALKDVKKKYAFEAVDEKTQASFAEGFAERVDFYWFAVPSAKEIKGESLVDFYQDRLLFAQEVVYLDEKVKTLDVAIKQVERRYGTFKERGIHKNEDGTYSDGAAGKNGSITDLFIILQFQMDDKKVTAVLWDYMRLNQ